MKTKEKKEKKVKITIKNLICFLIFVVFILYFILFYHLYFSKKVYATEEIASQNTEKVRISQAEALNLEECISQNTNDNGETLTGVNTKYATDKNWANRVYYYMQYLYNKL